VSGGWTANRNEHSKKRRHPDDMTNRGILKMVGPISSAIQAQPVAQSTGTSPKKPAEAAPKSPAPSDTVQLSQAAQATLAALQEARETPAQTAQEAGSGDLQAQRLLAKEAAAKPSFD
jgi:hypothetical protein